MAIQETHAGTFEVRFYTGAKTASGKPEKATKTFDTLEAAKVWEAQRKHQLREIREGRAKPIADPKDPTPGLTFGDVWQGWLERRPSAEQAIADECSLRVHLVPFFKDMALSAIRGGDNGPIQAYVAHMSKKTVLCRGRVTKKPLSQARIKNTLSCLTKLLHDHGIAVAFSYRVPKRSYAWLRERAEVLRFKAACAPWFERMAMVSVYSGLRAGEIGGLQWGDLDFERGQITVTRSWGGKPVKSRRVRYAPLPPELAKLLKPHQGAPGDFVIVREDGLAVKCKGLAAYCHRTCKRAGVTDVTFHQLRHTFASHQVAAGRSLPEVGVMLGHQDSRTTQIYAHLDPDHISRSPKSHLSFEEPKRSKR